MKKINYNWTEEQIETIDECRQKAKELKEKIISLAWLFEIHSEEENEFYKYADFSEKIEIFCENQLPF